MERSRIANRKGFFLLPLIAISIGLICVEKSSAWGKTWLGRNLEWQIRNCGLSLGPLKIRAQFVLRNVGFDTNVYYGATDEPVKDYTFTAGPAFNVYLPLKKKIIFHVYESPQYVYFKETVRERTWNNFFQGEVHFVFNRFVASVGVGREEAKQRWNTETDIPIFRKEDSGQERRIDNEKGIGMRGRRLHSRASGEKTQARGLLGTRRGYQRA
jgi:hypothetical protein